MIKYRKDALEYSYGIGGLIGLIIIAPIVFVALDGDSDHFLGPDWLWWIMRPLLSLFVGLIPTGLIGCITAGVVYLVLLPFRKKIPWERPIVVAQKVEIEEEPIVFEPINDRYEILDL